MRNREGQLSTNDFDKYLSFVENILKYEENEEIDEVMMYPFEIPRVPQQNDGSKCGHYVLYYIYKFLMTCPEYYNYEEDYPGFMNESWFTADEVNEFSANLPSWHDTMLKKREDKNEEYEDNDIKIIC
ncbi:hypothetical protein AgCh_036456 [Apium graveolens]